MDFSSGSTQPHSRRSWQGPSGGNSGGFTLIELIVVVVIVGIFAAIAIPNFSGLIHRMNVRAGSNELYDLLQYSRAEAVTRRASVTIQAPSGSNAAWAGNVAVTVTSTNAMLRQVGPAGLQSGIAITTGVGSIIFTPTGTASAQACFQISYTGDANIATQFIGVSSSGRVSAPSTTRPGEC